ncbi:MAG: efflux RND transporter permease subunit [Bacillota bacterium]|nr:efflux RND transporter permease subunit [Bacillota bacterium]
MALRISGEPKYGPGEVAQAALGELEKLSEGGKTFEVEVAYNAQAEIQSTLSVMMREVGLGAVVAIIVIFLFLQSVRATAVAAISIPTSIALALLILSRYHISLNIMTLGAMAVATGRVVDDAIVVTENIFRRARRQGYTMDLIRDAAAQVGRAITASTFTTVAVFLPLGLVRGIVGKVFEPFALTVMWSLMASLLVALTVVPALTYLLYRGQEGPAIRSGEREQKLRQGYQRFLRALWDRPFLTGGTALLLLALAGYMGSHLPVAFVPADEEPRIAVIARYPQSFDLAEVDGEVQKIDDFLLQQERVVSVQSVAGGSGNRRFQSGPTDERQASFLVTVASQELAQSLAGAWREELNRSFAPGQFAVTVYSSWTQTDTVELLVRGAGAAERAEAARMIRRGLQDVAGLEDIRDTLEETSPVVQVKVRGEEASRYGLTAGQILKTVHDALPGVEISPFPLAGRTYTLKVQEGHDLTLQTLSSLALPGRPEVPLDQVADVREVQEPLAIYRRDGEPFAMVQADVVAQDVGAVLKKVDEKIRELSLPAGIQVDDVGITLTIAEGFGDMTRAIGVAILVVYIIMLMSFGDALIPLAILISLPFAAVGAMVGLALTHLTLSIPALIGLLMLVGIVVTNAIVLMDRFHHQHLEGLPVREALLEASATRLRPILMTALATIGALTPLGLGLGQSSLIGQTVAVVVIGGLVTSTLLSLVLVPLTYELLHRLFVGRRA